MIRSKKDYWDFVEADIKANHVPQYCKYIPLCRAWGGYNVLYLLYLRRLEYIRNCKSGLFYRVLALMVARRLKKISVMTGITIPPNTFGKGLYVPHWGAIVVNDSAKFGDDCVIQNGVNISEGAKGGNHIYFATGSKVLRDVSIANDVIIAANAVVSSSISESDVIVAGIPAKVISHEGFKTRTII